MFMKFGGGRLLLGKVCAKCCALVGLFDARSCATCRRLTCTDAADVLSMVSHRSEKASFALANTARQERREITRRSPAYFFFFFPPEGVAA
jgi:hypothetical protein